MSYTVRSINNLSGSNGWIQAIVNHNNCNIVLTKDVWVGKPEFTLEGTTELQPFSPGIVFICDESGNPITSGSVNDPHILSINWSFTGPLYYINGDITKAKFKAGRIGGQGFIYANATNQCGSKENRMYFIVNNWFKDYPNPTNNLLTIELDKGIITKKNKGSQIKLYLFNKSLQLKKFQILSNDITTINISDLFPGVYVLQIEIGNKTAEKEIIIR